MNPRQRFDAVMSFAPADRALFVPYMGIWTAAWERWKSEGLGDRHWAEPFDFDVIADHSSQFAFAGVQKFLYPLLEPQVIKDACGVQLIRDEFGITKHVQVGGNEMIRPVGWPVTDEASWEQVKARLDPDTPGRLPDDFDDLAAEYRDRTYVLGIGGRPMGLFGAIRELMGAENALLAIAAEPDWVRRMAEHLADLWLRLHRKVLERVQVDFMYVWELICTNKGPMFSPRSFGELFLPSYRKLIGGLKEMGLRNVWVDCQGYNWDMLPLFIEAGATGTVPIEVQAGMDVVELRRRHPRLQLVGGIERMALARGRRDIDRELARVAPLVPRGGYIPCIDHYCTAEVSWDNFRYFIDGLRRITSVPIEPDAPTS